MGAYVCAEDGAKKEISVKCKSTIQIHAALMDIRNDSGGKPRKFKETVLSETPSIRPLWDPWHGGNLNPFDGSEQAWRRTVRQGKAMLRQKRKEDSKALLARYSSYHGKKLFAEKEAISSANK